MRLDESLDSRRSSRTRRRAAVPLAGREQVLNWGSEEAEAAGRLPGDELLEDADAVRPGRSRFRLRRPPYGRESRRWGRRRYTYDWIENLFGLNMHSADRVLPEFQHPAPGDTIGVGKNPMRIEVIEPERVYATRSANGT